MIGVYAGPPGTFVWIRPTPSRERRRTALEQTEWDRVHDDLFDRPNWSGYSRDRDWIEDDGSGVTDDDALRLVQDPREREG